MHFALATGTDFIRGIPAPSFAGVGSSVGMRDGRVEIAARSAHQ